MTGRVIRYAAAAICLGIVLCLSYCSRDSDEGVLDTQSRTKLPVQEGWNSKITISKSGLLQAVVVYGHMVKYDKNDIIFFDEGVEVDFYDDGSHTSHLISDRGEYNEKTEDVRGIGHVTVVSDSGVTLQTEILRWDNQKGRIYSDTLVMITTQDLDTLFGVGFESNADLTRRVIHKPWGKTKRSIDLEGIEESFMNSGRRDSVGRKPNGRSDG